MDNVIKMYFVVCRDYYQNLIKDIKYQFLSLSLIVSEYEGGLLSNYSCKAFWLIRPPS